MAVSAVRHVIVSSPPLLPFVPVKQEIREWYQDKTSSPAEQVKYKLVLLPDLH